MTGTSFLQPVEQDERKRFVVFHFRHLNGAIERLDASKNNNLQPKMPKLFETYWYKDVASVADAALFNLRNLDLQQGGIIPKGSIVLGMCGFAIAESDVNGYTGKIRKFKPNRRVEWRGYELPCMALEGLPIGAALQNGASILRHRHYGVAELENPEAAAEAVACGLPVVQGEGSRHFANMEVFVVPSRTPVFRRARLL